MVWTTVAGTVRCGAPCAPLRPGSGGGLVVDVTTSAAPVGSTLASPPARRVNRPRWFDLRLLTGVLLVLVSVIIGARVVAASDSSEPVWAAAHDLAAGTQLTATD